MLNLRNFSFAKKLPVVFAGLIGVAFMGTAPALANNSLTSSVQNILHEEGLTGAAWAVVEADGAIVTGAAGYSDNLMKAPFLPETRFHVGSVTKTLLATGVLRLASEGKIDLYAPISEYLPNLAFDNKWAETSKIKVRHLLDHTSGIDDARLWQMFSQRPAGDTPLLDAFNGEDSMLRVRARPGTRLSYSNMGYGLLGLIIEAVTDERYETYLDQNLLRPLGMESSTFSYTTQSGSTADPTLAWGHIDGGKRYAAVPIYLRPAGQFTTTVSDYGIFAKFLMSDGTVNGEPFILPDLMQARGKAWGTEAASSGLKAGYALGIGRRDRHGAVGYCHSGNIIGFVSLLCVYPESGKAFAYSVNTDSESADYTKLAKLFTRELKLPASNIPVTDEPAYDVSNWNGTYILAPNRFQSFAYLDMLFGFMKADFTDDHFVLSPMQSKARKLRPTGGYLFSAEDRLTNSHILMLSETGDHIISDGFRTFKKVNPALLIGLWASLVIGLLGILWILGANIIHLINRGTKTKQHPLFLPFISVLGLAVPVPFFFTQSFMALGDMTPASLLLAMVTLFLPLSMVLALLKIAKVRARSHLMNFHGFAATAVLQMCLILGHWDMLPFMLWI